METDKKTISVAEAAKLLGISTSSAYRAARRDELPGARRLGRRVIIHRPTFMAWLAGENEGGDDE